MAALKFSSSHNMVAFLDKPTESDGFEQIVDFLNAHPFKYALTVNPIIYTTCIEQFWTTAKVKTFNGEVQIQALVDKKENWKEWVLRLLLGTNLVALWPLLSFVLPQTKDLTFPMFLDKQVEGMSKHKRIYVTPSHTKKVFANMKRQGKDFSGRDIPLFQTMMVQAQEEGEGSVMPTVPQHTPTINQPSSSPPPKKQKPGKSTKQDTQDSQPSGPTEPMADETENVESVPIHSIDPLLSGEDRLKLNELIELCTNLSQRVLDLENKKTSQAAKIAKLKERVKKLERRNKSRTSGLKRLRKVGRTARIESSKDKGLGDQEDASKQGRKIADIDADEEVTLIDKTQGRNDDNLIATTTTIDELTLAQTLIEIKAAKPKVVTTASTTTTTVAKDKGKAKMVEHEKPLKKKDQILIDEEIAQRLQEELQVELEEEERLARQKEEDANITKWDNRAPRRQRWYKKGVLKEQEKNLSLIIQRIKKQKIDDDQEEAEMKKHMEIVVDEEEIAVDAIPLATKPPVIKLVKAKHGNTRPEEAYERVLWGDLKVMFKPDVESESTVDACTTAKEMWIAIERLQQEWLRFVTVVKQTIDLDKESYHKLFDILKQYQNEVNEIRAKKLVRSANPLALVATTQHYPEYHNQAPKPHKSIAYSSKETKRSKSHASTKHKGKEIAKPITPPSESTSDEDSDPEQAQRDKQLQKYLALVAKYIKNIYSKPTNNNLRTSSNTGNKNMDTTPRYGNDRNTGQFMNERP
ncbi:hypothetical protein Tco_0841872 [Tanacetum coccineum]|uniref:Xylulose kinase-1 n=1 Tax=Tanacetum coccineum TaxID=301880 RepID=A0ABQ5AXP7_9ASTR